MSKERRRRELEREMANLQKRLKGLQGEYEEVREDDNEEFSKDFENFSKRRDEAPLPPKPVMPPFPPRHFRRNEAVVHMRKLSDEERKTAEKERERILAEKERIANDIKKMKEDFYKRRQNYSELRRDLRHAEEEIRQKERELRAKSTHESSYSWDDDMDKDIDGVTRDLELRLGDYTRSILASVAESLKASMGVAVQGAGDIGKNIKVLGEELGKIGKDIGENIGKDVVVNIGPQIPEDKLEEFYQIGANIVGAIGDPNRLHILKELEKGPKYQKELSDITNLRGGTFKHHMDKLLEEEVNFVTQEVVRGRYFLTTRGREALKLAEMQYIRYLEEKTAGKPKKNIKVSLDIDDTEEEFDVDVK